MSETSGPEEVIELHEAQEPEPLLGDGTWLKRFAIFLGVIVVLFAMVTLPPLINVSRYQRRIATSISASLGRPVHLDSVTLNVLPMPGFTLNNFVVSDDPAFGAEPVIRANTVRATLRMSSLWRRRVEFSKISLTEPSVNLVHLSDGRWNLESILIQASRMPVAPTEQKRSGETQRFPYIEATDARVNIKMGSEKTPFSLTDAEFALWLPEPEQWKIRLEAHPARTDTAVSDTGTLRVEGRLGRAASLAGVPIDLKAVWSAVPLGAVSLIAMGEDAGMRGEMTLTTTARGTVGDHAATTQLKLTGLRRADFVPVRSLDVNLNCSATVTGIMHSLKDVRCLWPVGGDDPAAGMTLTAEVPDTHQFTSAFGAMTVKDVPASALLDALRVASSRIDREVTLAGVLNGSLTRPEAKPVDAITGAFAVADTSLAWGSTTFVKGEIAAKVTGLRAEMIPVAIDLGGREQATLGMVADPSGVQLDLHGSVSPKLLRAVGAAMPEPETPASEQSSALPTIPLDTLIRRSWAPDAKWVSEAPIRSKPKVTRKTRVLSR